MRGPHEYAHRGRLERPSGPIVDAPPSPPEMCCLCPECVWFVSG